MKHHQRRAAGAFPYYKLATWDAVSMTWRDGKRQYQTREEATAAAPTGKNRISEVTDAGRRDDPPFTK